MRRWHLPALYAQDSYLAALPIELRDLVAAFVYAYKAEWCCLKCGMSTRLWSNAIAAPICADWRCLEELQKSSL